MTVVAIKPRRRRSSRDLPLGPTTSGAGRFFDRMVRDIETDLGGRRQLSRIEGELIRAFAGASTQVRYLTHQIMLGESSELDFGATYAQLASTMLRIGSRLGLPRRPHDITPTLSDILQHSAEFESHEASDAAAD